MPSRQTENRLQYFIQNMVNLKLWPYNNSAVRCVYILVWKACWNHKENVYDAGKITCVVTFSTCNENLVNRYHLILSSPSGPNWVRRMSTLLLSGASCNSKDLYFPSSGRHCEAHCAKKDLLLSCAVDIIWIVQIYWTCLNYSHTAVYKSIVCWSMHTFSRVKFEKKWLLSVIFCMNDQLPYSLTTEWLKISYFQTSYLPVRLELYQCSWESVKQHTSYTKILRQ